MKLVTKIDLHCHSTASDGSLSPEALVRFASELEITHLALTDHDTVGGLAAATETAKELDVHFIPGVEFSCHDEVGQIDILGYGFDPNDEALLSMLGQLKDAREQRAVKMVEALKRLGARIDMDLLRSRSEDGLITRPHVAHCLVESGFVDSVSDAFDQYIARGRPAYIERFRLTPSEACQLLHASGGLSSWAHPVPARRGLSQSSAFHQRLKDLVEGGLAGLECHYWGYGPRTVRWLRGMASHYALAPTGGSDYHGPWRENRLGEVDVPEECLTAIGAGTK